MQGHLRRIPSAACGDPAGGNPLIGQMFFSVPYHTTAVTAQDLCNQWNIPNLQAAIGRIDAATGAPANAVCGTPAATSLNLVLGEAVRMRRTSAGPCTSLLATPAHF